jgi:hypothetical protein
MTRGWFRHLRDFTFEPDEADRIERARGKTHDIGHAERSLAATYLWARNRHIQR